MGGSLTGISKGGLKMSIRLIALDLDGTLLTADKSILPETAEALEDAQSKGIYVVPATGRPFSGIPANVLSLSGLQYLIASNGALTYNIKNNSILRKDLLKKDRIHDIFSLLDRPEYIVEVFVGGRGYHEEEAGRTLMAQFRGTHLENYLAGSRTVIGDLKEFVSLHGSDVENISVLYPDIPHLEASYDELTALPDISVVRSTPRVLEIGGANADKGKALTALAETLGLKKEELMVFGDSNNDFGLFEAAGTAVAMENATPELKALSHLITKSNEENGIAHTLRTLLP